jgi:hypothetical protein
MVMNELRINFEDTTFNEIIMRYYCYRDYCKYYENDNTEPIRFVQDPNGIPCFWFYDVDKVNASDSNIVIIDIPNEGIHRAATFNQYDKTKKYILMSSGWWDVDSWQLDIDYELLPWNNTLYNWQEQVVNARYLNFFVDKNYKYDTKSFLFCSTIGVKKSFRELLVDKIQQNVINKNYILNYNGEQLAQNSRHLDIAYDFEQYNSYKAFADNYSISTSIPIKLYNECYFNLVVETNGDLLNEFHISEKIIKPLMVGMPFVMAAGPGYLKHIRNLGFKTFDNFWSEEYDKIENTKDRIDAIIALINSLNNFDWAKYKSGLEEITNFNKLHLAYNNNTLISELKNFEQTMKKLL